MQDARPWDRAVFQAFAQACEAAAGAHI
jgi:hypothetical protein